MKVVSGSRLHSYCFEMKMTDSRGGDGTISVMKGDDVCPSPRNSAGHLVDGCQLVN